MVTKILKWGNSQGLRIPRDVIEAAHLKLGDEVELKVEDGAILVIPARRVRGRLKLEELVARIPKSGASEEISWGPPVGKEVW
ncbi:MAG: AbrB/MazE/SpoVT family DNA-binding domain-containing protein [Candidatus Hydrogenedentes bacterium]|nr:AbrB/MazE/SpoVT family DNA-binding domain-containing protein [Candidatus Hydrogenedentota bacterium]